MDEDALTTSSQAWILQLVCIERQSWRCTLRIDGLEKVNFVEYPLDLLVCVKLSCLQAIISNTKKLGEGEPR